MALLNRSSAVQFERCRAEIGILILILILMKRACQPDASIETERSPSRRTLRGLDWLNFLLADVQTGVGPFIAIYLAGYRWDEERVGLALTVGGIAGILTQTPSGALVDFLRSKRALVAVAVAALAAGALVDWRHVQRLHPSHLRDVARGRWTCRIRHPPRPQSDLQLGR